MTDTKAFPASVPDPVDSHIGRRAAGRRRSLGLPAADVAHALGIDEAGVHDLEQGLQRAAARQLWVWSSLLHVPIAWFFKVSADAPQPVAHLILVSNPDFDRTGAPDPAALH